MIVETVVALLMIVDHEIKEHRLQPAMSDCLKGKRIAERQLNNSGRVQYKCLKSKAELEVDKLGTVHIKKLILE